MLYRTLLEGRIQHRTARAYLVLSMLLAVILPALDIPVYKADFPFSTAKLAAVGTAVEIKAPTKSMLRPEPPFHHGTDHPEIPGPESAIIENGTATGIYETLGYAATGIYILILIVNLGLMMNRILQITALRRKSTIYKHEQYSLAINGCVADPFSFMKTIYMNRETMEGGCREIMEHELSHVRHHHTAERLMMEFLRCVFWFNPFIWMAGQSLIEVQEWEADADVLDEGYDLNEYRTIIFSRLIGCNPDMTSGLHDKTTKKRLIMMTQNKRDKFSFIRLLAAAPLAAGMFLAFSCTTGRAETPQTEMIPAETSDTIAKIAFTPPAKGEIMHYFGFMTSMNGETFPHNSIDIKVRNNDPICATAAGTVSEISIGDSGYGNTIRIDHEHGYKSFYAHLTKILVKEGDKVAAGLDLKSGSDYIEFTEDGEMLFVNGETKSTEKARYSYNREKAELTIDMGIIKYTTYLTITNQGILAAVIQADHYLAATESADINIPENSPIKVLTSEYDGLVFGATFSR